MSLYNLTAFYQAASPVDKLIALNALSGNIMFLVFYVSMGLGLMIALYYRSKDAMETMAFGGFGMGVVGGMFFFLELLPAYAPFIFFTFAAIGVVMRLAANE